MYYAIRHVTRFHYSAPITESAMEVRMQPRREARQQCLSFELTTSPSARILSFNDYLGNIVHSFSVPVHHTDLVITAQSMVSVNAPPPLPQSLPLSAWDELAALAADSDVIEMMVPSHFARPTELLGEFMEELSIDRRADPLTLLRMLNGGVHRALMYMPESTRVDSPIDEALEMRRGVCQDFTHIMITMVRELGIPCRYVSGYLYRPPREDQQMRHSATHAWLEALLPGLGWTGFDPTNNVVAGDRHIRIAVGRDYADVPPTRGVFKGRAATQLGVAVQIVPADEALEEDQFVFTTTQPSDIAQIEDAQGEQPQQQQQSVAACRPCISVEEP
jgi:transglutaminase-like putative cysteine protease